ncbi:MAG TPA: MFS transporter [Gaiellaceae bacterium]|jgi:DHA3 family tetracycline resistance protein-like MFS transporter|nr:MFS transporter [Gaiellaceae bacterium]
MRRLPATAVYFGLQLGVHLPTWVVMAVYLVRELHFSPLQLVLMGTAMEAAVFLGEVPTGVVADTYSRRLSLIIGYVGMGVAWAAVGLVSAPWLVIALWAVWGLSYTFTSGAEQAWITDEVGVENVGRVFLRGARYGQVGSVLGLLAQVGVGVVSLRAGVILGGVFTILCGLGCLAFMPEHGFVRRPREERGSALAELRTTASAGARYAWAAPAILLLIGVELFMGASSEAFDRLKEAHFLRDVGLPGEIDPVVWFGLLWLAGMLLNIAAIGSLIKRVDRGGRESVARYLFAFVFLELVAMLVFAVTGSVWLAVAGILGVFFARNMAGPLFDTWLNEQITDSSVRATVISLTGQSNAIGQSAGGPVLGVVGNVWGIRAALAGGAAAIAPALALFARAIAHHGREPELEQLPTTPAID